MTSDAAVRQLAQQDPVPNLTARWGELVRAARDIINGELTTNLRDLAKVEAQLAERGLTVATDLGPIGNSAKATFADLEREPRPNTFHLPEAN